MRGTSMTLACAALIATAFVCFVRFKTFQTSRFAYSVRNGILFTNYTDPVFALK